ncbi:uncharacterized protein LOC134665600 [Cydia fagiglandana]|uniref:uncharacterized protein LOC134665600 n=1 Tax=Cydia fagiglandana TaxID=1458189 RepID=UPI002FEE5FC9
MWRVGRQSGDGQSALAPSVLFPPNSASRAPGPALRVAMKPLHTIFIYFSITNIFIDAKIHGGPRGRFANHSALRAPNYYHVSSKHTHFTYHPPTHITFMCRHCAAPVTYPVFHGQPPTYVYKYRETVSRYGVLLTGLALYNLGRSPSVPYHVQDPEEKCNLQIRDWNHFEQTTFPCFIMSTFIERKTKINREDSNTFDVTSSLIDVKSFINNTGYPILINRHQDCVIWHNTSAAQKNAHFDCALLKEYADTMKPGGVPVYIWLPVTLAIVLTLYITCQCICRKKKEQKEEVPLNQAAIIGYCSQ